MKSAGLTFAIVAIGTLQAMAAPPAIYNLGTLGGDHSTGNAINNSGQVTGSARTPGGVANAFLYTPAPGGGGAMVNLGTLGGGSIGYAINDAGQVAGTSNRHVFLYTGTPGSGGVMHDLGTLYQGTDYVSGLNAAGQIVGRVWNTNWERHVGFLYSGTPGAGGAMVDLSLQAIGEVRDINDAGQMTAHYWIYTPAPGGGWTKTNMGTLGGEDWQVDAKAINNAGQVTGRSATIPQSFSPPSRAFLYTGTPGSMLDLGTLPGGTGSEGLAINAAGQIAGWSDMGGGFSQKRAFLYTGTPGVNGQMIDLNAWLDTNNPIEGAKWTLLEARGINDYGLITGEGIFNDGPGGLSDGTRAFILDASSLVPEPSSAMLLAVAGLGLLARRRPVATSSPMSNKLKGAS
ncbi:MAG TPA: PEP-CTERM sorting domain-containing protein [Tepidisphaeraceae bacterium]|nr:PEP-CTERM sorting domain-containing protein [Tepidisphaeraceae bacterium]